MSTNDNLAAPAIQPNTGVVITPAANGFLVVEDGGYRQHLPSNLVFESLTGLQRFLAEHFTHRAKRVVSDAIPIVRVDDLANVLADGTAPKWVEPSAATAAQQAESIQSTETFLSRLVKLKEIGELVPEGSSAKLAAATAAAETAAAIESQAAKANQDLNGRRAALLEQYRLFQERSRRALQQMPRDGAAARALAAQIYATGRFIRALEVTSVQAQAAECGILGTDHPGFQGADQQAQQLQPHQQRVIEEHSDLAQRADRLQAFIEGDVFDGLPLSERLDLGTQLDLMRKLQEILERRIGRFKGAA
jgi:hypothetical protein